MSNRKYSDWNPGSTFDRDFYNDEYPITRVGLITGNSTSPATTHAGCYFDYRE